MNEATVRNIIISLILIVGATGGFGFMAYKINSQATKLEAQVEVLEGEQAREASYRQLQRTSDQTLSDREQLQNYFLLRQSDSIDFLSQVEALAPQAGVFLETKNLEDVVGKEGKTEWIVFDFSFSGPRERVQKFVEILETMPYITQITSVYMSARSSSDWNADLTIKVRVLAYDE